MEILLKVLSSLAAGIGCYQIAKRRGQHPLIWFVLGLLLGIFALIFLCFMPLRKKKPIPIVQNIPTIKYPPLNILHADHMDKLWYFLDEQKTQFGPMSFNALNRAWNEGKVKNHTFVWNEAMENWQRFEEVISSHPRN
jgi:hypothetical protein